ERGLEPGAGPAVAQGLELADDVGADLEPAGVELGLDHLLEGLALLPALGVGVDHELRPATADLLVGGERRLPQREDADDPDREADDPEEHLEDDLLADPHR